jgi:hypothetical protein
VIGFDFDPLEFRSRGGQTQHWAAIFQDKVGANLRNGLFLKSSWSWASWLAYYVLFIFRFFFKSFEKKKKNHNLACDLKIVRMREEQEEYAQIKGILHNTIVATSILEKVLHLSCFNVHPCIKLSCPTECWQFELSCWVRPNPLNPSTRTLYDY